jgi:hypothetical protein
MADITTIEFEGEDTPGTQGGRIKQALDDTLAGKHKLSNEIAEIEGMSGQLYRRLINNLVAATPDARYLETGSLKGSTACSAMYKNKVTATCIENFHWDYRELFYKNTKSVLTDDIKFRHIENDFRAVDYENIGKYNIYMFDGPHEHHDQYDGVQIAQPALDDSYILIVDDWNWANVQNGTWDALRDLGYNLISKLEIKTTDDNTYPKIADHFSDWHNGYLIAAIEKE